MLWVGAASWFHAGSTAVTTLRQASPLRPAASHVVGGEEGCSWFQLPLECEKGAHGGVNKQPTLGRQLCYKAHPAKAHSAISSKLGPDPGPEPSTPNWHYHTGRVSAQ